jgi:UDP-N-acetylglucosamine/UDP-N-acetylgalactosamine diphosphorylase
MIESSIHETLFRLGQQQLLTGLEQLSQAQLHDFALSLSKYDPALSAKQKEVLLQQNPLCFSDILPYLEHEISGDVENREYGRMLVRQEKVGCLILAGGQGTRLKVDGPKGCFPVSPIQGKSLFQLFCERTKAASAWSGHSLPLCIMTSACNHAQTIAFLQQHDYFGLHFSQVSFIEQSLLPFLDDRGNWLLEKPGKIAEGPDGNGDALRLFFKCGFWDKWKAAGIEYLNVIFVDNALADPFDPEFVGFTAQRGVDIALKAVDRLSPDEKMGILTAHAGKLKVIEYSEIPRDISQFTLSSTGMLCISMQFIHHLYQELNVTLPLHLARKRAPVLLGTSKGVVQEIAHVWKCERFIFDLLDHARTSAALVYPRGKIYAPLKNATGERSIETVKQALLLRDREIYQELTGRSPPVSAFELDPAFYYPSEEMKLKLHQFQLSEHDYVSKDVVIRK